MPRDLDFFKIRPLNGDREYAFEELCTQLARRDARVMDGSRFFRLEGAGGDGGVECYWKLPTGKKWGWQAKLIDRLKKPQIEKSIRAALLLHPELERYIICMPFDLTGPTGRGGRDQLNRWDMYISQWQSEARARDIHLEFEFWGKSELIDKFIASDSSGGRQRFWFEEEYLARGWFERQIIDATIAAGPRYNPELNVKVAITDAFDALGDTSAWRQKRIVELRALRKEAEHFMRRAAERTESDETNEASSRMSTAVPALRSACEALDGFWNSERIERKKPYASKLIVDRSIEGIAAAQIALRDELETKHGPHAPESVGFRQFQAEYMVSLPAEDYDCAIALIKLLGKESEFLESSLAEAMSVGVLLVTGVAGAGKTHAVCDAAKQRLDTNLLSVVCLGQQLVSGELCEQLRHIFGLPGDLGREQMLGALNCAGESSHDPLVVFIDALNEREPRSAWKNDLAAFVEQVRRYPWLRLCITCRTTYMDAVLPTGFHVPTVEHKGFSGVEFEACFAFFSHWKLEPPSVPLLQPQYANPLFLKMICIGLSRSGRGSNGSELISLSEVVDMLLTSAEQSAEEQLDIDARARLIHQAIDAVLAEMRRECSLRLSWKRADEVINSLLWGRSRSRSLLDFLLREGLLTEVQVPSATGSTDLVCFGFERLGEYLFTARALDEIGDGPIDNLFIENGALNLKLARWISDDLSGIAEALAILLPERRQLELTEIACPITRRQQLLALARSLAWRRPDSISSSTKTGIREVLATEGVCEVAMEELLSIAVRGEHPLGIHFFDRMMRQLPQTDRDPFICGFLHSSWERGGAVRRLSTWALRQDLGSVTAETALSWCQTLLWFCAAADRRVRDFATMGAVALMERQPAGLANLIERMCAVDDEYIIERLLLTVYGSLIRSQDPDALANCAHAAWKRVFEGGPPLNAMIRDYARCIVEIANERGVLPPEVDLLRCRPPFQSDWLTDLAPADKITEPAGFKQSNTRSTGQLTGLRTMSPAIDRLRASVEGDDFAVYTMPSALKRDRRPSLDFKAAQRWILEEVERMGFNAERFDQYDGYMLQKYGAGRSRPSWAERLGKKYQWIALYRLIGLVSDNIPLQPDRWDDSLPRAQVALLAPGERNLDATLLARHSAKSDKASWWAPVEMEFRTDLDEREWLDALTFPESTKLIEITDVEGRRWLPLQVYTNWDTRQEEDDWNKPHRHCFMQIRSYLVAERDCARLWEWLRRQDFHNRWMPEGGSWLPYVFAGEYPWSVQARCGIVSRESERSKSPAPVNFIPATSDQVLEFDFDAYHDDHINLILPNSTFFEGAKLRWDLSGGYLQQNGDPALLFPCMTKPGPIALLAERAWLDRWLKTSRKRIVWTVLSEMQWRPGDLGRDHKLGYAVHSRAHRLHRGKIESTKGKTYRVRPKAKA